MLEVTTPSEAAGSGSRQAAQASALTNTTRRGVRHERGSKLIYGALTGHSRMVGGWMGIGHKALAQKHNIAQGMRSGSDP